MSTIDQQSQIESLLNTVNAGGETGVTATRALIRAAMRIREHWLPRGTIEQAASHSDLCPPLPAGLQSRAEETLIERLNSNPDEQEQVFLVNALSQWGGERSARFLSGHVLAGEFSEEVVNQCLVAFGILGGPDSVTALVHTMMYANERLASNADRNLSELADGGQVDMSVSSPPLPKTTIERILLATSIASISDRSVGQLSQGLSKLNSFLSFRCGEPEECFRLFKSIILRDRRIAAAFLSSHDDKTSRPWTPSEEIEGITCNIKDIAVVGQLLIRSAHANIAGLTYRALTKRLPKSFQEFYASRSDFGHLPRGLEPKESGNVAICNDEEVYDYLDSACQQGSLF